MNRIPSAPKSIPLFLLLFFIASGFASGAYKDFPFPDKLTSHPEGRPWAGRFTNINLVPPLVSQHFTRIQTVRQHPDAPRSYYQRGRSSWMAPIFRDAPNLLEHALQGNHAAADVFWAKTYLVRSEEVPTNTKEREAFRKALEDYKETSQAARNALDRAQQKLEEEKREWERKPQNMPDNAIPLSASKSLVEQGNKEVFRAEEFHQPEIMEALYYGDFSEIRKKGRNAMYLYSFYLREFNNKIDSFGQSVMGYRSCAEIFNPAIDGLVSRSIFRNNPAGDTQEEILTTIGKAILEIYKGPIEAMKDVADYERELKSIEKSGAYDAIKLSRSGCGNKIIKQIYGNIVPFLKGHKTGVYPIIATPLATYLGTGCQMQQKGSNFCRCMTISVLRSNLSSEDESLLAANFSTDRIERMKQKYPSFEKKSKSCF